MEIILPGSLAFRGKFVFNNLGVNIYLVNEEDAKLDVVYTKNLDLLQKDGVISKASLEEVEKMIESASSQLLAKNTPFQV